MPVRHARAYFDMLKALRAFFDQPQTPEGAMAMVRDRIARRGELFLTMARERFFAAHSPYRPLLALAQCAYSDLEAMVRQHGVETTLQALRKSGVYLSYEEFKFGTEVRRDGRTFRFAPTQFDNYRGATVMATRSGGTRSTGTWMPLPIDHLALVQTAEWGITLKMLSDPNAPILIWQMGFPSGAGSGAWFNLAKLRRPPVRWFSLTPIPRGIQGRPYWGFRTARWMARRAGIRAPGPDFTPVRDVGKVLDAVQALLVSAGRCVIRTTPSCAVRLATEARQRGRSLRGVLFLTTGEPLTPAKAEEIHRLDARVFCHYVITEVGGSVGAPCGNPVETDEMHFRADALAMISSPHQIGDLTVDALMLTSLLPTAPKLLLNVEVDDFAHVQQRPCGCLWDELGCRWHLSDVRSLSKLTGEGTTLLGSNCVHIIERVLPEAFGGSSVDYQLVEAEDEAYLTRVYLLVSPRVGPIDSTAVLRKFAEALDATSMRPLGGRRTIWEQAQSIRVVRRDPITTGVGKLLPFHTLGAAERVDGWRT